MPNIEWESKTKTLVAVFEDTDPPTDCPFLRLLLFERTDWRTYRSPVRNCPAPVTGRPLTFLSVCWLGGLVAHPSVGRATNVSRSEALWATACRALNKETQRMKCETCFRLTAFRFPETTKSFCFGSSCRLSRKPGKRIPPKDITVRLNEEW